MIKNQEITLLTQHNFELSTTCVGGDQKGAKSGKGGVVSKTLSPRVSPLFRLPDAA